MKRRNIYIVVFVVSVLGLAFVQYKYLRVGLKLASTQFSEKIELSAAEIQEELSYKNQLTFLMANALAKDTTYFRTSSDSIIDASSHFFRDYLQDTFTKNGLRADFSYELSTRDASYYLKGPGKESEFSSESFPVPLKGYLPELFDRQFVLNIRFKPLRSYFYSQLNGLIYPSVLFLLGIIITVIWALRTYYWQSHKIEATNEFLNNLTHELRTPVFGIQLATKILQEKQGSENQALLSLIRSQTDRLTGHIDRVLQLSALENLTHAFEMKTFDLRRSLMGWAEEFSQLAELEGFTFSSDLGSDPLWIRADE